MAMTAMRMTNRARLAGALAPGVALSGALGAALGLAACTSEEDQARDDAAKIAMVEANQTPPALPLRPQALSARDLSERGTPSAGCYFRETTSGDGALAFVGPEVGYVKLADEVERLAPDMGSPRNPVGLPVNYDGTAASMTLTFEGTPQPGLQLPARMELDDGHERPVYQATGTVRCNGMNSKNNGESAEAGDPAQ